MMKRKGCTTVAASRQVSAFTTTLGHSTLALLVKRYQVMMMKSMMMIIIIIRMFAIISIFIITASPSDPAAVQIWILLHPLQPWMRVSRSSLLPSCLTIYNFAGPTS